MKSNYLNIISILAILSLFSIASCSHDDPKKEDVPELITTVKLTFTPDGGGDAIIVAATDPDGEGVAPITVDGPINLTSNTTYTLKVSLVNELADPSSAAYDITKEVEAEGDEHMFFFSWTNDMFSDPGGNGNIDNRNDVVKYTGAENSIDANGLPLGLTTTWKTSADATSGNFRVLLKHQPDLKSAASDSSMGETDLDVTFGINVD